MRPLPLVCGLLTAAAIGSAGLAPAANAATEIDLHSVLSHGKAFPNATGQSEYERGGGHREVEVTVRHIAKLAGKRVTVYVNYKKVGTMLVNQYGTAHREWDTNRGQYVPYASAGNPIRVRTATGTLVASGTYHREYGD
jgi:hypothetical protein